MTLCRAALVGLLSAPLLTGCGGAGPSAAPVKGKIVSAAGGSFRDAYPADPALPPGDPGVRVKLVALNDTHPPEAYPAVVDPDAGTFEVPGPAGHGVPAGKYRAVVYVGAAGAMPTES